MRRFLLCLLMLALLMAPSAQGEEARDTAMVLFEAFMAMAPEGDMVDMAFDTAGSWTTAVQQVETSDSLSSYALTYDEEAKAFVSWEDVFTDGEAAAERMAAIAEGDTYQNAYAEHNGIAPVPRDNFGILGGVFTVYYPWDQLHHFSGRAGAYSFYAYELEGLLKEDVPLAMGNAAEAGEALVDALGAGALPGYEAWAIGGPMADAAEALGLTDVPDLTYEYAVYRFEDPRMRGMALLSAAEEDQAEGATILGMYGERMDFSGLITGRTSMEACLSALGPADGSSLQAGDDPYSLRPGGETLWYAGEGAVLELHFVEGILHSLLLRAGV